MGPMRSARDKRFHAGLVHAPGAARCDDVPKPRTMTTHHPQDPLRQLRCTEPSMAMVHPGLWATSQGWPSGSMKMAEYPPQKVGAPSRPMVAPADSASAMTRSTSSGDLAL